MRRGYTSTGGANHRMKNEKAYQKKEYYTAANDGYSLQLHSADLALSLTASLGLPRFVLRATRVSPIISLGQ